MTLLDSLIATQRYDPLYGWEVIHPSGYRISRVPAQSTGPRYRTCQKQALLGASERLEAVLGILAGITKTTPDILHSDQWETRAWEGSEP